jgi:hypothetical protein
VPAEIALEQLERKWIGKLEIVRFLSRQNYLGII